MKTSKLTNLYTITTHIFHLKHFECKLEPTNNEWNSEHKRKYTMTRAMSFIVVRNFRYMYFIYLYCYVYIIFRGCPGKLGFLYSITCLI